MRLVKRHTAQTSSRIFLQRWQWSYQWFRKTYCFLLWNESLALTLTVVRSPNCSTTKNMSGAISQIFLNVWRVVWIRIFMLWLFSVREDNRSKIWLKNLKSPDLTVKLHSIVFLPLVPRKYNKKKYILFLQGFTNGSDWTLFLHSLEISGTPHSELRSTATLCSSLFLFSLWEPKAEFIRNILCPGLNCSWYKNKTFYLLISSWATPGYSSWVFGTVLSFIMRSGSKETQRISQCWSEEKSIFPLWTQCSLVFQC